jgi:hypothetical protein
MPAPVAVVDAVTLVQLGARGFLFDFHRWR